MKHSGPILLVEDNQVDIMTVQRAFKQNKMKNTLIVTTNGEDALMYLRRQGKYAEQADWAMPAIILLDLNMPIMNGIEFLKEAKLDSNLKNIPVVVLTTSKEESDRVESFDLSAAGYIIKPVEFEKFVHVVKVIDLYWTLSELP